MGDNPSVGGPANPRGVNGLVMNLILPGLGSLYCGQSKVGAIQLALLVLGVLLLFTLIPLGILLLIGDWIWSAMVGFQLMASST
ncbi:MAG TPA: hypothetical protein VII38_03255 [Polyangia bacterium]|jgi:hypothetical protein